MGSDLDDFVEEVRRAYPDPVDVFEDRLAAKLGLERGPGLSEAAWRQQRVAFIDSFADDDDMAATVAAVEREIHGEQEEDG